ncbi:cytochrome P450 [Thozetella sp. PMI_491]|nr:cytochrome P450 [Thozetella sp. PMI_491]
MSLTRRHRPICCDLPISIHFITSPDLSLIMFPNFQFPSTLLLCGVSLAIAFGLYLAYQLALPKPYPNIPYNPAALRSIFGDVPEIRRNRLGGLKPAIWISELGRRHGSPLVQIFIRPFSKPILVLSDYDETCNTLIKRDRDFDRSKHSTESFAGLFPSNHLSMKKSHPNFKSNRDLVNGLMSPSFLNTVCGPETYKAAAELIEIWRMKASMSNGRPFSGARDITAVCFESIQRISLGPNKEDMVRSYLAYLRTYFGERQSFHPPAEENLGQNDNSCTFPDFQETEEFKCIKLGEKTIVRAMGTPVPKLFWKLYSLSPAVRNILRVKEESFQKYVSQALLRLRSAGNGDVTSGLEYMLQREILLAEKASREPAFDTPTIRDELYAFFTAGSTTTSTAFTWIVRYLTKYQDVQRRLYENLVSSYPAAASEARQPTFEELRKVQAPYLEAVIEEVLRLSGPIYLSAREAQVDTMVMGHHVPKGTTVIFNLAGPSITTPPIEYTKEARHQSSKQTPFWNSHHVTEFLPERWLKPGPNEGGAPVFDSKAGPFLSFSGGSRGCYGKRFAYMELRVLTAMVVWNFTFENVPGHLNTDDVVEVLTRDPAQCFIRLSPR